MGTYSFKDWAETIYYLIAILGIPLALIKYFISKHREQKERDDLAYEALDQKYLGYLDLCLENSALDVFDVKDIQPKKLDQLESKKELIIFTQLFSIFERAYRMLKKSNQSEIHVEQWDNWDNYLKAFCQRQNFRSAWIISRHTFDEEFQIYVNEILGLKEDNIQLAQKMKTKKKGVLIKLLDKM